jgi:hypothetical protein
MVEKSRKSGRIFPISEENEPFRGERFFQAPWNTLPATNFRAAQAAPNTVAGGKRRIKGTPSTARADQFS